MCGSDLPEKPKKMSPRKLINNKLFCGACQSWEDIDNFPHSANRTFNRAPHCDPCNKARNRKRREGEKKIKNEAAVLIEASSILIYATPDNQDAISNFMTTRLWNGNLDFRSLQK